MLEKPQTRSWLSELLTSHPALLVSLFYLLASLVGMSFSWDFFRLFGVNIFNYAEISDFLLASLREPMTWLVVVFAIVLVTGDNAMSRLAERKLKYRWLRWYGSSHYRRINYFAAIVLAMMFIHIYATFKAREIRAGVGKPVQVTLAIEDSDNADKSGLLLGTTTRFLFLYEADRNVVEILPHENIATIVVNTNDETE